MSPPAAVRPLSMREIDLLLDGIVRSLSAHRRVPLARLDDALTRAREAAADIPLPSAWIIATDDDHAVAAFGMTVYSLAEWCHPIDILTALARVHARLAEICRSATSSAHAAAPIA